MISANKHTPLYNSIELQPVKSMLIKVFKGSPDLTKMIPKPQNYLSSRQRKGATDKIISFQYDQNLLKICSIF
jgi:hypothetical protein